MTWMVAVEVVDAQGRTVSVADNEVTFRVTGSGRLIGVGNGDPSSHESDKGAGELVVAASSPGLQSASVTIACNAA
jgi:beta-galactosidase